MKFYEVAGVERKCVTEADTAAFTSPRRGEVGSRLRDPGEGDRVQAVVRDPLTRNVRAMRAHPDLSPQGRGDASREFA
jgi:hypothetical protein